MAVDSVVQFQEGAEVLVVTEATHNVLAQIILATEVGTKDQRITIPEARKLFKHAVTYSLERVGSMVIDAGIPEPALPTGGEVAEPRNGDTAIVHYEDNNGLAIFTYVTDTWVQDWAFIPATGMPKDGLTTDALPAANKNDTLFITHATMLNNSGILFGEGEEWLANQNTSGGADATAASHWTRIYRNKNPWVQGPTGPNPITIPSNPPDGATPTLGMLAELARVAGPPNQIGADSYITYATAADADHASCFLGRYRGSSQWEQITEGAVKFTGPKWGILGNRHGLSPDNLGEFQRLQNDGQLHVTTVGDVDRKPIRVVDDDFISQLPIETGGVTTASGSDPFIVGKIDGGPTEFALLEGQSGTGIGNIFRWEIGWPIAGESKKIIDFKVFQDGIEVTSNFQQVEQELIGGLNILVDLVDEGGLLTPADLTSYVFWVLGVTPPV